MADLSPKQKFPKRSRTKSAKLSYVKLPGIPQGCLLEDRDAHDPDQKPPNSNSKNHPLVVHWIDQSSGGKSGPGKSPAAPPRSSGGSTNRSFLQGRRHMRAQETDVRYVTIYNTLHITLHITLHSIDLHCMIYIYFSICIHVHLHYIHTLYTSFPFL